MASTLGLTRVEGFKPTTQEEKDIMKLINSMSFSGDFMKNLEKALTGEKSMSLALLADAFFAGVPIPTKWLGVGVSKIKLTLEQAGEAIRGIQKTGIKSGSQYRFVKHLENIFPELKESIDNIPGMLKDPGTGLDSIPDAFKQLPEGDLTGFNYERTENAAQSTFKNIKPKETQKLQTAKIPGLTKTEGTAAKVADDISITKATPEQVRNVAPINKLGKTLFEVQEKFIGQAGRKTARDFAAKGLMDYKPAVELATGQKVLKLMRNPVLISLAGMGALWTAYSIGKTAIEVDTLTNWASIDNIISAQAFLSMEIARQVRRGEMTAEEARPILEDAKELMDLAAAKIETSGKWNPLTKAQKDIWDASVESGFNTYNAAMDIIDLAEPTPIEDIEGYGEMDPDKALTTPELIQARFEGNPEEVDRQMQTFRESEIAQANLARQKKIDEGFSKRRDEAAARNKDSASVGPQALTRTPQEKIKRRRQSTL